MATKKNDNKLALILLATIVLSSALIVNLDMNSFHTGSTGFDMDAGTGYVVLTVVDSTNVTVEQMDGLEVYGQETE